MSCNSPLVTWQAEEETVAFLAHSGSEEEFDPSTLPDPDKYKDSDEEQDSESEDSDRYVHVLHVHFEMFIFFRNCLV